MNQLGAVQAAGKEKEIDSCLIRLSVIKKAILRDELLLNQLKGIPFSDISIGGLLGLLNSIAGLRIVNLEITGVQEVFAPDVSGCLLSVSIRLEISGHTLLDFSNLVSISLELTTRVKYSFINFQSGSFDFFFHECGADFGGIKISLLGITLTTTLVDTIRNSLIADINLILCGVVQTVFNLVKSLFLDTVNVAFPLGPFATLRFMLGSLPVVSDGYTNINLYINVEVPGQGILSIPDLAGSINVPPLGNFKHVHAFHPALINILLFIFAPKDSFELPCTPDKFSGADDLRNAILVVVPLENQAIVSAGVLNFRISTEMYPEADFGPNGIVITLTAKIEFFIRNADGSTYFVLVMRSRVTLGAVLSFVNGKVIFVASITGNALELISSDARINDVS
uniref:BPI fold-containing family B member 4-like n=1 Tax=Pogona vitticeps TaxID=103695 RepID=A0ABM5G4L9_9SAUR